MTKRMTPWEQNPKFDRVQYFDDEGVALCNIEIIPHEEGSQDSESQKQIELQAHKHASHLFGGVIFVTLDGLIG